MKGLMVFDRDIISVNNKKLNTEKRYYVYVYMNPLEPGVWWYNNYIFPYKPFYIGKGTKNRLHSHIKEALNTNKQSIKLNKIRELLKEGSYPCFGKISEFLTEEEALYLEDDIIRVLQKNYNCLSNSTTLSGSFIGFNLSKHPNKKEICEKISRSLKGIKRTPQQLLNYKLAAKRRKYKCSDELKQYLRKINSGKKLTEETKQKQSLSLKMRWKNKTKEEKLIIGKNISKSLSTEKSRNNHSIKAKEMWKNMSVRTRSIRAEKLRNAFIVKYDEILIIDLFFESKSGNEALQKYNNIKNTKHGKASFNKVLKKLGLNIGSIGKSYIKRANWIKENLTKKQYFYKQCSQEKKR